MCVIIKREAKIIIPEEKIRSACHVNGDGFGFSVVDRGKIETIKVKKEGIKNEADEVLKLLEDAKENEIFLHLRYTTAGKTNEDNCHPFTSFNAEGYEVQFMHNGTLSKFSKGTDHDHSDTWHFNEQILKPLLMRFYEVDGAGVLLNPLLKTILDEFRGGGVFMLYDNEGNSLAVENTSCKQFEGWWASNEYSFNRTHRDPVKPTYDDYDRYDYGSYYNSYSKGRSHSIYSPSKLAATLPSPTKTETTSTDTRLKAEAKQTGYAIMQAKKHGILPRKLTAPEHRPTFVELANLESLNDIMVMTESDIYDVVNELPQAATALIMDLIHELWVKNQEAKRQESIVKVNNVTPIKGVA
jgi:hypothetical protein